MSITPGASSDHDDARRNPRVPGGVDPEASFIGGNRVGREASGLDEARGIEPGEGSLVDRDMPMSTRVDGRAPQLRGGDADSSRLDGNTHPLQSRRHGRE